MSRLTCLANSETIVAIMRELANDHVRAAIRKEMERIGMTQQQLGQILREHQTWVSRRLTGTTQITVEDLARISAALSITPDAFFLAPQEQVA